jgi:hypothetical protein
VNPKIFFGELKRRNVYKVAAAYAVVGWFLIQVATQVFPFLDIPNRTIRLVILLTALGFPVALIIAWAFELTPEGIKSTENADAVQQHSRGGVWSALVIVAAMLSLGLFFLGRYTARTTTAQLSGPAAAVNQQKSITVLPLVNTSGDPNNEYFSDGLSEELIAVVAKIPELKGVGPSSSFFFKGKSGDSTAIDQKRFHSQNSNGGAFQVAVLYAIRKEPDEMFKWLDTAYATRDSGLSQLPVTPFFLPYMNDPRFVALCQKLNVQVLATSTKP